MTSRTTKDFREAYQSLPLEVQKQARETYVKWKQNPQRPSLHFKRIHSELPIFSIRIGIHWRAVGIRRNDALVWFWIGSHGEYDKLVKQF
jgi:hypothetical protein